MKNTKNYILKEIENLKNMIEKEKIDITKKKIEIKSQVNYQRIEHQPEKIKNIIHSFNYSYENIFKFINNTLDKKIISDIYNYFDNVNENLNEIKSFNEQTNINYNNPKNKNDLDDETKKNLENLQKNYEKIIKEFKKSNMLLIDNLKCVFYFINKLLDNFISVINSIYKNISEYEQIGYTTANKKDEDPIINESISKFYNYYRKIVESLKIIDIFFKERKNEEENFIKRTPFNKLEGLKNQINNKISEIENSFKDIQNYFPTIIIDINRIKNIYNSISQIFSNLQRHKDTLKLDIKGENEMRFDILIILDTTNSMEKYLKIIKKELKSIIERIKEECPLAIVYTGFIGYKDFCDLELGDEYIDIDFKLNIDEICNKIKDIEADGGGDIPEDIAGAFELALIKSWGLGSKLAILITDSPCHGIEYHDLGRKKDNYPDEVYSNQNNLFNREKMSDLVEKFTKEDISLVCFDILKITDKMFSKFKEIYNKENKSDLFSIEKGKLEIVIFKKAIDIYKKKEEEIKKYIKENIISFK